MNSWWVLALVAAVGSGALSVPPGERFEVPLPSLASAGYEWHLTGYDSRMVSFKAKKLGSLAQPKPGKSPDEIFVFQALQPGTTDLHFAQYRSWEGPEGAKAHVVSIRIGR